MGPKTKNLRTILKSSPPVCLHFFLNQSKFFSYKYNKKKVVCSIASIEESIRCKRQEVNQKQISPRTLDWLFARSSYVLNREPNVLSQSSYNGYLPKGFFHQTRPGKGVGTSEELIGHISLKFRLGNFSSGRPLQTKPNQTKPTF